MKNNKIYFDTNELRTRIIKQYGTIKDFAAIIGMNPRVLAGRLAGRTEFNVEEMGMICKAMNLNAKECDMYFFTTVKDKLEQLAALVDKMTDSEFELLRQIMTVTNGRPDLRQYAKNYNGKMNDLPAALRAMQ